MQNPMVRSGVVISAGYLSIRNDIRKSCEIIEIKKGNLIHIYEDFTVERKGMLVSDSFHRGQ